MLREPGFRDVAASAKRHYQSVLDKLEECPIFDVRRAEAEQFSPEWILRNGLESPVLLLNSGSPCPSILPEFGNVHDCFDFIAGVVGPSTPVKLIDVVTQFEITGWSLGDYSQYFRSRNASHKVLNMISLEISLSPLSARVCPPSAVRRIDWIDQLWPLEKRINGDFPQVQKYCLVGLKGAYTDFHIDFGGTSVWYHILYGKKVFYFVPPTPENLRQYENWAGSSTQNSVFFGDMVKGQCFRVELTAGKTLIIPSGWIHAVYTPEDSVVFGGNFLHSFSIIKQLQVYLIEQRTNVLSNYRVPYFRQICWGVVCQLLAYAQQLYRPETQSTKAPNPTSKLRAIAEFQLGVIMRKDILHQFLFLLKVCEKWIDSPENDSERMFFHSLAKKRGCSPQSILRAWWELLGDVVEKQIPEYRSMLKRVQSLNYFNIMECAETFDEAEKLFSEPGHASRFALVSDPKPVPQGHETVASTIQTKKIPKKRPQYDDDDDDLVIEENSDDDWQFSSSNKKSKHIAATKDFVPKPVLKEANPKPVPKKKGISIREKLLKKCK